MDLKEGRFASVDQEDPTVTHRHGLSRREGPAVALGVSMLKQHLTGLGSQTEQALVGDRDQQGLALEV